MTPGTKKNELFLIGTLVALVIFAGPSIDIHATENGPASQAFLSGFLYFGDSSGRYLSSVEQQFPRTSSPHERAVAIITALIQGPPQGLSRTLPQETRLNALFIDDDGSAYIDLDDTITNKLPGGAESELLAIYSIVNSLALNIPEIERVKFLVQGMDARTLTGHMDLENFFRANMLIIR